MNNECVPGLSAVEVDAGGAAEHGAGQPVGGAPRGSGDACILRGGQPSNTPLAISNPDDLATGGEDGWRTTVSGGLSGLMAGALVGGLLYAGLLRIPLRWFFSITGILVLLLAANMASQAARFLIQADWLPSLGAPLWDTSTVLSQTSALGTLLHGIVGYESQPAGMQVVFYVTVLIVIAAGMRLAVPRELARTQQ